jgi:hypothetical protein
MKSLKSSWKVCLGILIGFVLGSLAFRIPIMKAEDAGTPRSSAVRIRAVDVPAIREPEYVNGDIVGFSCIPVVYSSEYETADRAQQEKLKSVYSATCYIATR